MRTWESSTGQFKLTAKFVGRDESTIYLQREDGGQSSIQLHQLSEDDQLYVRLLTEKQ